MHWGNEPRALSQPLPNLKISEKFQNALWSFTKSFLLWLKTLLNYVFTNSGYLYKIRNKNKSKSTVPTLCPFFMFCSILCVFLRQVIPWLEMTGSTLLKWLHYLHLQILICCTYNKVLAPFSLFYMFVLCISFQLYNHFVTAKEKTVVWLFIFVGFVPSLKAQTARQPLGWMTKDCSNICRMKVAISVSKLSFSHSKNDATETTDWWLHLFS